MSALRLLKHRIKSALGRPSMPPPVNGVAGADWYDKAYEILPKYADPYWQSHYYSVWTPIVDRVRRDRLSRVVDIGCGPGQFAQMLFDMGGITEYTGLDFSPTAVSMAELACPKGRFVVGDATKTRLCLDTPHDVVICMEVLEHVPDDEGVIRHFQPGVRAICTVPNFDYESHVRFFKTAEEVTERYGRFFDRFDVFPILGHYNRKHTYYVMDGIRKS